MIVKKLRLTLISALLSAAFAVLLVNCEGFLPKSPPIALPGVSLEKPSYSENAVASRWTGNEGTWYEIFTWSFYDSNGDGKGDIRGIIQKLDYLNDTGTDRHNTSGECNNSLHIDGIWLTPIMPADSYHKYDTYDYLNVDPDFGTLDDVRELLRQCHERGMKLIVDLAVNHTSPNHSWFKQAVDEWKSGTLGKYASYYNLRAAWDRHWEISDHWYDTGAKMPDGRTIWYYGAFGSWMPDLNWDNTALMQEFEQVIKFWLSPADKGGIGLDGFRLDATKHIFEVAEWTGDTNRNVAFWTWFARTCRKYNPNAFMVGECLDGDDTILDYHRPGMSSFALGFANDYGRIITAVLMNVNTEGDKWKGSNFSNGVLWWTNAVKARSPYATGSPFLSNHDFDRSSNHLKNHQQRKMAASLLLFFPGTPFMYYGEEIGLLGWKQTDPGKTEPDDKYVRGPMIFSTTDPAGRPKEPPLKPNGDAGWIINTAPNNHGWPAYGGGVDQQLTDENSLLRHYIKIQNLKKKYPWIAWGATSSNGFGFSMDNDGVDNDGQIAAYRVTDDNPDSLTRGRSVVIVHNTSEQGRSGGPADGWANGYIKVPNAKGFDAVSAAWIPDPVPVIYDSDLDAYWIKPYATAIFREYE